MTELEKYDLNGDGVLDAEERKLMLEDRRRRIEDDDKQRDQIRVMVWYALAGMLLTRLGSFFVIFSALIMPLLFLVISLVLILLQFRLL